MASKNGEVINAKDKATEIKLILGDKSLHLQQLEPSQPQTLNKPQKLVSSERVKIIVAMMEIFANLYSQNKEWSDDFETEIR